MATKRSNRQHQEVFLLPTGNQAVKNSGTLSTSGAALNIASGQLGVKVATHDANLPGLSWGDWLPDSTSAQDVDAITIVQGTANSANTRNVRGWDINRAMVESPIIRRNKIRSFTSRIYKTPTYSAQTLSGFNGDTPLDNSLYKMYITTRSVRKDLSHGRALEDTPFTFTTPEYTGLASITQPLAHLLQNFAHNINLQSKGITTAPNYQTKGQKEFICFALDISGGSGTAVGTITCNDSIDVMSTTDGSTTVTSTFLADQAFVGAINEWINDANCPVTAATTIEVINVATAGTAGTPAVDAFVVMGLDDDLAEGYDDVYSTKVNVNVELGESFRLEPLFTKVTASEAYDGASDGRGWRIRYDQRAHGLVYTEQLSGHSDDFIQPPSGIDEAQEYSAFIIDCWDDDDSLTKDQQHQKRVVILMPVTVTCVEADVLGTYDVEALAPDDGDTIVIGSETFENNEGAGGITGGNIEYDGTAADFATQLETAFPGTSTSVSGNVVTVTNVVNAQATTVAALNASLGYWLDTARVHGNAFNINADAGVVAPDGSGDPTGTVPGSGTYFV